MNARTIAATSNDVLSVENVSYAYKGAEAVRNVSLRVDAGEIVALLGSNGAGKTTTAKLIAGALRPQQGTIRFGATSLAGLPSHRTMRKGVVLVPEGRLVFAEMSVHENLLMGAYKEKSRQRVAELLETSYSTFPRLKERTGQLAGSLSGGEQQMLAIARGMMAAPRLLILDEPSLGIMPKLVLDIFTLIGNIADAGVSVLLIEQNARASLELASRAYVLEKGQVAIAGTSAELLGNKLVGSAYLGEST